MAQALKINPHKSQGPKFHCHCYWWSSKSKKHLRLSKCLSIEDEYPWLLVDTDKGIWPHTQHHNTIHGLWPEVVVFRCWMWKNPCISINERQMTLQLSFLYQPIVMRLGLDYQSACNAKAPCSARPSTDPVLMIKLDIFWGGVSLHLSDTSLWIPVILCHIQGWF